MTYLVKTLIIFTVMTLCTVVGNLLFKLGAVAANSDKFSILQFANWKIFTGLACFGLAAFIYLMLLRTIPLNVAQSFLPIQFISVIIASAIILGEPIGLARWTGIFLIMLGIAIVAYSLQ